MCLAQTKTTNELTEKHSSWTVFLYHNTMRMINQKDDKDLDELIKDIEKVKIVNINKKEKNFGDIHYKALSASYKAEGFEEIMTTRYEGKNFNAYIKQKDRETIGMVLTVSDSADVYVMDLVGKVALNKIISLFNILENNTDIQDQVRQFVKKRDD
jgi:hypothetical protein